MWSPLASASVAFLVAYDVLFAVLVSLFVLRRVPRTAPSAILLLHVVVRLAAQATGLAYGVRDRNIQTLLAYSTLAAQGQFLLLLCAAHTLHAWQSDHRRAHRWLIVAFDTIPRRGQRRAHRGGGGDRPHLLPPRLHAEWHEGQTGHGQVDAHRGPVGILAADARAVRAPGRHDASPPSPPTQRHQQRHAPRRQAPRRRKEEALVGTPTLGLLTAAWPFLVVRGVWGVMQAAVPDLNVSIATLR